MNQNRNQNRRRGRGGNRGQGGGNQGNRIDSRARGNAPQLLEKYKKLAHDASLNGDRVQTEYYLQFADHYFRVVADSRAQREEQRPRRDDRDSDREQSFDEADNADERDEVDNVRRSPARRRERDDNETPDDEGERGVEGDETDADADDNPFVRDTRGRRPRSRGRSGRNNDAPEVEQSGEFDPGVLPPSIARDDETPARPARTRARRPRPTEDDGGDETLEAVS